MIERRFELVNVKKDCIEVKDRQYGYIMMMDGLNDITERDALDFVERLNCQVSYDRTNNLLMEE